MKITSEKIEQAIQPVIRQFLLEEGPGGGAQGNRISQFNIRALMASVIEEVYKMIQKETATHGDV